MINIYMQEHMFLYNARVISQDLHDYKITKYLLKWINSRLSWLIFNRFLNITYLWKNWMNYHNHVIPIQKTSTRAPFLLAECIYLYSNHNSGFSNGRAVSSLRNYPSTSSHGCNKSWLKDYTKGSAIGFMEKVVRWYS